MHALTVPRPVETVLSRSSPLHARPQAPRANVQASGQTTSAPCLPRRASFPNPGFAQGRAMFTCHASTHPALDVRRRCTPAWQPHAMARHASGTIAPPFCPGQTSTAPPSLHGNESRPPHGLPKMLQHIQHGGVDPVKGQSPRLLFQRELNVVAAFPLKTDMTGRRGGMGQQARFVDLKQQHLSPEWDAD